MKNLSNKYSTFFQQAIMATLIACCLISTASLVADTNASEADICKLHIKQINDACFYDDPNDYGPVWIDMECTEEYLKNIGLTTDSVYIEKVGDYPFLFCNE